jgi:hypothetical protein
MQNDVKAQATTTKRSTITVSQLFCWFKIYGNALNELCKRNVGTCNQTGKTFGELSQHFVVGGDETCILSRAGELMIVGSMDQKKHEKAIADSRVSMTLYCTGSIAGTQGPTIAVMAGKH